MSSKREQIINYLGAGVSQSIAAEAAGVTPAYVSQLLTEPGVLEEIARAKAGKLEQAVQQDATLEDGEKKALAQTIKLIPFIRTAKEAASVYGTLNAAKRKAQEDRNGAGGPAAMSVTLVLPKAAKILINMDTQNQIVEVDGVTTAPLPSKALPSMAARLESKRQEQLIPSLTPKQVQQVTDLQEKAERQDVERAKNLLAMKDVTTIIDGVQVVI